MAMIMENMENISEQKCTNVFAHDDDEIPEAFTRLWTQIINKKESENNHIGIASTDVLDL